MGLRPRAPFAELATVAWGSDPVRHLLSSPRTGSEAHATARKAPTRAPFAKFATVAWGSDPVRHLLS